MAEASQLGSMPFEAPSFYHTDQYCRQHIRHIVHWQPKFKEARAFDSPLCATHEHQLPAHEHRGDQSGSITLRPHSLAVCQWQLGSLSIRCCVCCTALDNIVPPTFVHVHAAIACRRRMRHPRKHCITLHTEALHECPALQSIRDRYPGVFGADIVTMQRFMWQLDIVGVAHSVMDCFDYLDAASPSNQP
jgi:hypothetical protein